MRVRDGRFVEAGVADVGGCLVTPGVSTSPHPGGWDRQREIDLSHYGKAFSRSVIASRLDRRVVGDHAPLAPRTR